MSKRLALAVLATAVFGSAVLAGSDPAGAAPMSKSAEVVVTNGDAQPVPVTQVNGASFSVHGSVDLPQTRTHVAAAAELHVTLRLKDAAILAATDFDLVRVHMDGTLESDPYVVPAGWALVVTDATFIRASAGAVRGDLASAPANASSSDPVAGIVVASAISPEPWAAAQFPAGVVIGPGRKLHAGATLGTFAYGTLFDAIVHGYLVPIAAASDE